MRLLKAISGFIFALIVVPIVCVLVPFYMAIRCWKHGTWIWNRL